MFLVSEINQIIGRQKKTIEHEQRENLEIEARIHMLCQDDVQGMEVYIKKMLPVFPYYYFLVNFYQILYKVDNTEHRAKVLALNKPIYSWAS